MTQVLNDLLGYGSILLQIAMVCLLVLYVLRRKEGFDVQAAFVGTWGLLIAFVASSVGAVMTLVYSDILGFEPCPLCWWQRIFLYPQVIAFGMALWKKEYRPAARDFSIVLSVIGAGIAAYHHMLQMYPGAGLPCPATGPSCAQILFLEFGYITYPIMAFSLFAFLTLVGLIVRSQQKN